MSKNIRPRTEQDLQQAAVDVAFEFKMFRQAWARLDVSSPSLGHNNSAGDFPLSVSYDPSGNNATTKLAAPTSDFHEVEGILVHFRNLIEFFFTDRPEKNDLILAHHYTGQAQQQIPVWAKRYEQRCNELLAHLTYRRSNHYRQNGEHHWTDIAEKYGLMDGAITEFLNFLSPERRAWFK